MPSPESQIIWLDRQVIGPAIKAAMKASEIMRSEMSRLRDVEDEGWDLFLQVLADGSLLLNAVAVSIPCEHEMCTSDHIPEYRSEATNSIEAIHHLTFASGDSISSAFESLSLTLR